MQGREPLIAFGGLLLMGAAGLGGLWLGLRLGTVPPATTAQLGTLAALVGGGGLATLLVGIPLTERAGRRARGTGRR